MLCLAAAGCHRSLPQHRLPLEHLLHVAFKQAALKRQVYRRGDDFVHVLWLLHRLGLWLPRQGAVLEVRWCCCCRCGRREGQPLLAQPVLQPALHACSGSAPCCRLALHSAWPRM